jgi:hypothetical protein
MLGMFNLYSPQNRVFNQSEIFTFSPPQIQIFHRIFAYGIWKMCEVNIISIFQDIQKYFKECSKVCFTLNI